MTNFNAYDDVARFMKAAGQEFGKYTGEETSIQADLYADLIEEEFTEFVEAFDASDIIGEADACADLIWVILGYCHSRGIPIQTVWNRVATSNLSKIMPDGTVHKREDGKILKPDTFCPVDLSDIFIIEE